MMRWEWLIPVVLGIVAAAAVVGWVLPRSARTPRAVRWVANSSYLRRLPTYRSRLRLLQAGLAGLAVFAIVGALGASLLLARPADRDVRASALANRDIVLCLDVSGSMIEFDTEIVGQFSQLVEGFDGERIALSVWNSTSRTVFPLTDDYTLVTEELEEAAEILDFDLDAWSYAPEDLAALEEFIAGTLALEDEASSLVGDGLASCAYAFDDTDSERSRSIVLATDNQVLGVPIYQLDQAAELASERGIRLYGLFASTSEAYSEENEDAYRAAMEDNGGLFYHADDPTAVDAIVDDISRQQAVELDANPEVVLTDRPETVLWLAVAGVAGLIVVAWRLRS
ncbi:hypothetical protein V2J15_08585 [Georgenia sp. MJ170]